MKQLYVSNSESSTRMFSNNAIEFLSKVHFTVPLLIYIPVIIYCLYQGITAIHFSIANGILFFCLGLIAWSITEYVMHRFIFHFHPKSQLGKRIHFIFHGVHHDYPRDRLRLVLPPIVSIPLASLFYFLYSSLLSGYAFYCFFGAFLLGYLSYDMIHYAIHHVPLKGKIWGTLKTHHLKHHYVHPEKGFGVTSPLWDKIAATEYKADKKYKTKSDYEMKSIK